MTTVTQNKRAVSLFFEEFSKGDITSAFSLVSEQVVWWVPGHLPFSGTKTKSEYMQIVSMIKAGFPEGLRLAVTRMTAEENRVAAEVESFGTHLSGKVYNNKYHFLFVVENGVFVEVKEYMDTLHLYQLIQP